MTERLHEIKVNAECYEKYYKDNKGYAEQLLYDLIFQIVIEQDCNCAWFSFHHPFPFPPKLNWKMHF